MDPNRTSSRPKADPYALTKTENRSDRRYRSTKAQTAAQARPGVGLSAREMFVTRTASANQQTASIKLTPAQKNALDAIAGTLTVPRISDATFSKLEGYGLVKVDVSRPHRGALTDLGVAYLRRAPKGGKR